MKEIIIKRNSGAVKLICLFFFVAGLYACTGTDRDENGRTVTDFNFGWKFHKGDIPEAYNPGFDDSDWLTIDLPHDWSIEGPFSSDLASCTGYLPGGTGWYRKTFNMPRDMQDRMIYIYFDGVYKNSEVWINGNYLGKRPNGYISFQYDMTPYIRFGSENVISVKVDHMDYADSRWYTGSGIYRDVKLIACSPVHIKQWGIFASTPIVTKNRAVVDIDVNIINESGEKEDITLENFLLFKGDTAGKAISRVIITAGDEATVEQQIELSNPQLWDIENPSLYRLASIVKCGDEILDNCNTNIGIRKFAFDPDKGFSLNGKPLKIKGVCLHHEAGCLGAAVPDKVWKRRLDILKEMGCNAIRTSHNPPSSSFLDMCDKTGFLVNNETFDEWELPKRKWIKGWNEGNPGLDGSASFFSEWHTKDLEDHIRRDRNHPSVIMWSIGNEIDYPTDPYTHISLNSKDNPLKWARHKPGLPDGNRLGEIAEELAGIVKKYDDTRPVTAGLASVVMSDATGYSGALDIAGYNYQEYRYDDDHKKYPGRIMYGSETGMSPASWYAVKENDYISGQFVWTGIDYLGEAGRYPFRSNTSGAIDMAGNRKAEFYYRQSIWTQEPMVYIATSPVEYPQNVLSGWNRKMIYPVWNGREDQVLYVYAFTNCREVELFLNNRSLGRKQRSDNASGIITWEVPFKKGILKASGIVNGTEKAVCIIETPGKAGMLSAEADNNVLKAGGKDIAHIGISITDDNNIPVSDDDREILVEIDGPARLLGMEDSNPQNTEDYKDNRQSSFHGKLLLYIQTLDTTGKVRVRATSPGLDPVDIELYIK